MGLFELVMNKSLIRLFILAITTVIFPQKGESVINGNQPDKTGEGFAVKYITSVRILWKTDEAGKYVIGTENLLKPGNRQVDLSGRNLCYLENDDRHKSAILFDFGRELNGGIVLVTDRQTTGNAYVRLSEMILFLAAIQ